MTAPFLVGAVVIGILRFASVGVFRRVKLAQAYLLA